MTWFNRVGSMVNGHPNWGSSQTYSDWNLKISCAYFGMFTGQYNTGAYTRDQGCACAILFCTAHIRNILHFGKKLGESRIFSIFDDNCNQLCCLLGSILKIKLNYILRCAKGCRFDVHCAAFNRKVYVQISWVIGKLENQSKPFLFPKMWNSMKRASL